MGLETNCFQCKSDARSCSIPSWFPKLIWLWWLYILLLYWPVAELLCVECTAEVTIAPIYGPILELNACNQHTICFISFVSSFLFTSWDTVSIWFVHSIVYLRCSCANDVYKTLFWMRFGFGFGFTMVLVALPVP